MLQKVYFLSFGSIFLRKRFLLSYFFCKFVARIYQAEASKRKRTSIHQVYQIHILCLWTEVTTQHPYGHE